MSLSQCQFIIRPRKLLKEMSYKKFEQALHLEEEGRGAPKQSSCDYRNKRSTPCKKIKMKVQVARVNQNDQTVRSKTKKGAVL